MEELVKLLSKTNLFLNISEEYIKEFVSLEMKNIKKYRKNEILFSEGDRVEKLHFLVNGEMQIVKYSYMGQKSVLLKLNTGDFFAEAIAFSKGKISPVTVETTVECEVLLIDIDELINSDKKGNWNTQFVLNMLELSFEKSFALNKKIEILSQRTIRDKFLTFLDLECKVQHSETIKLPFNRQTLANYLEVDRTALFRVMKQLEEEGYIKINGKKITMINS